MPLALNRSVRAAGSAITLVVSFTGAHFLLGVSPEVAAIVGLAFALVTYLALTLASRGAEVPGLRGRGLIIYLMILGLAMALFGVVLPMIPGIGDAKLLSLVLVFSAIVYIGAALFGYARLRRGRA